MVGSDLFDGFDVSDSGFFESVMNFIDFPMENIDLDGEDCDAFSQLSLPGAVADDIGNVTFDGLPSLCVPNISGNPSDEIFKPKELPSFVEETSGASMTLQKDSSDGLNLGMFQACSPVSVLESSSSCSVEKSIPVGSETSIPVRRSKRSRSSSFKLEPEMSNSVKRKPKKKKKLSQLLGAPPTKKNSSASPLSGGTAMKGKRVQHSVETKKCTHCEVTKTPQWREGPMGPRTLCNACGVRYKSGRLFPEYRPASSPAFDPSLHSNSHKKVIEKRNMANQEAEAEEEAAMAETDSAMSPPPEFVPMSSYLFD